MTRLAPPAPIVAILYKDGEAMDSLMPRISTYLADAGLRLGGFVQYQKARPDRCRCDMILRELSSGVSIGISQDRGQHARGCRLDVGELLRAMDLAREALATRELDLLLVNKFGKTECEGGGLRPLIVDALEREVPVLIAVPFANLESWRAFAGDFCVEHRLDDLPEDAGRFCDAIGLGPRATASQNLELTAGEVSL